jgi:hypothetical protein
MQILELVRVVTWFGVGLYCLYLVLRNRGYVAVLPATAGNLRVKRFQRVSTGLGILFLVAAVGELITFLRVGLSNRGTAWSGLVMIGMGVFTFQFGLTAGIPSLNGLNPRKKPFSVWASRLVYTLLALVFFYWGVQDLFRLIL